MLPTIQVILTQIRFHSLAGLPQDQKRVAVAQKPRPADDIAFKFQKAAFRDAQSKNYLRSSQKKSETRSSQKTLQTIESSRFCIIGGSGNDDAKSALSSKSKVIVAAVVPSAVIALILGMKYFNFA